MARQLSMKQRETIALLLKEGESYAFIAREIGVHRSTVKREVDRNSVEGIYHPRQAHSQALSRKRFVALDSRPPLTFWKNKFVPHPKYQSMLPGFRSVLLRFKLFYRKRFGELKQERLFRSRWHDWCRDDVRYYYRSLLYRNWKLFYDRELRVRSLGSSSFSLLSLLMNKGRYEGGQSLLRKNYECKSELRSARMDERRGRQGDKKSLLVIRTTLQPAKDHFRKTHSKPLSRMRSSEGTSARKAFPLSVQNDRKSGAGRRVDGPAMSCPEERSGMLSTPTPVPRKTGG